jgi:hypothetical protein
MDTFYLSRADDSAKVSGQREVQALQRALQEAAVAESGAEK